MSKSLYFDADVLNPDTVWLRETVFGNLVTFRSSGGEYLGTVIDELHAYVAPVEGKESRWKVRETEDGSFLLEAHHGFNLGVREEMETPFFTSSEDTIARWIVRTLGDDTVTIQAHTGQYMSVQETSGRIEFVGTESESARWKVYGSEDGTVTFRSPTGWYLSAKEPLIYTAMFSNDEFWGTRWNEVCTEGENKLLQGYHKLFFGSKSGTDRPFWSREKTVHGHWTIVPREGDSVALQTQHGTYLAYGEGKPRNQSEMDPNENSPIVDVRTFRSPKSKRRHRSVWYVALFLVLLAILVYLWMRFRSMRAQEISYGFVNGTVPEPSLFR